ncbi:MAG: cystathionine beta-lyase [Alphaproteobacteria bacterium]
MQEPTKLIHAGRAPFENNGILNPPIYNASTILFPTYEAFMGRGAQANPRMRYGRGGTPTMLAAEQALCALECADHCRVVPSGLAAVSLVLLSFAQAGQHILVADNCYEPTRLLGNGLFKRLGIEFRYFDPLIGGDIDRLLSDDTALVFMESPGSLSFELTDIPAIVKACKARNIPTAIDNTWSAGIYLKPLTMGVDVSLQAATKYISGSSDLMMGMVVFNEGAFSDQIIKCWAALGAVPAPDVMFGVMRGLRSLPVRLDYHQKAGLEIANWLESHPLVKQVIHPALPSHPQHQLWKRDFSGASGLFSIMLDAKDDAKDQAGLARMLDGMRYFKMGFSWGGYESLITPYTLNDHNRSHLHAPASGQCLRLHIGQEGIEDLKQDLQDGLDRYHQG